MARWHGACITHSDMTAHATPETGAAATQALLPFAAAANPAARSITANGATSGEKSGFSALLRDASTSSRGAEAAPDVGVDGDLARAGPPAESPAATATLPQSLQDLPPELAAHSGQQVALLADALNAPGSARTASDALPGAMAMPVDAIDRNSSLLVSATSVNAFPVNTLQTGRHTLTAAQTLGPAGQTLSHPGHLDAHAPPMAARELAHVGAMASPEAAASAATTASALLVGAGVASPHGGPADLSSQAGTTPLGNMLAAMGADRGRAGARPEGAGVAAAGEIATLRPEFESSAPRAPQAYDIDATTPESRTDARLTLAQVLSGRLLPTSPSSAPTSAGILGVSAASPLPLGYEAQMSSSGAIGMAGQSALAPQVGTTQWQGALGAQLAGMVKAGDQSAELMLNPPNLGRLKIHLSVESDQASVQFTAPQVAVRDAIESALPRLREMMADGGLDLVDVNVSDQDLGQNAERGDSDADSDATLQHQSAEEAPQSMEVVRASETLIDAYV